MREISGPSKAGQELLRPREQAVQLLHGLPRLERFEMPVLQRAAEVAPKAERRCKTRQCESFKRRNPEIGITDTRHRRKGNAYQ